MGAGGLSQSLRSQGLLVLVGFEAYPQKGAIRIVGGGKGWHKSTMHHKFLIGMDMHGKALWCTNGSFNMTTHALSNLENCTIFEDPGLARLYYDEFRRVFQISTKLRIKV